MSIRDATNYEFFSGGRRVHLNQTRSTHLPVEAAKKYLSILEETLGAKLVDSWEIKLESGGFGDALILKLPPDATHRQGSLDHSAFLGFPVEVGGFHHIHLSLAADAEDSGARSEFERLYHSVRPISADPLSADPMLAVRRTLLAGPEGKKAFPVGSVQLDLTPDYRGPDHLELFDDASRKSFALELADESVQSFRSASEGEFDQTPRAWMSTAEDRSPKYHPIRRPGMKLFGMAEHVRSAVESGGQAVGGKIGGTPVVIRFDAPDPHARQLAERILESLR